MLEILITTRQFTALTMSMNIPVENIIVEKTNTDVPVTKQNKYQTERTPQPQTAGFLKSFFTDDSVSYSMIIQKMRGVISE